MCIGCAVRLKGGRLMCPLHWRDVPPGIKDRIVAAYGLDGDEFSHQLLRAVNEIAMQEGLMSLADAIASEEESLRKMGRARRQRKRRDL
jgi:hypothetical protein